MSSSTRRRTKRSYKGFAEKISPTLDFVAEEKRATLLREIYELVREAAFQELQKPVARRAAKQTRQILPTYRRSSAAIKNALNYVQKALSLWPAQVGSGSPAWVPLLQEATRQLKQAEALIFQHEGIHAAAIHPKLRRLHEDEKVRFEILLPGHKYRMEHFRSVAVEHWLIERLNDLLSACKQNAAWRHRLISEILVIGLNDSSWSSERVKRALCLRLKRSRKHSSR